MKNSPLVVIVGPTASGKSSFAMEVAEKFDGEIICADSRTVYSGMNIGTAKPSIEDQSKIHHHLLDIVEPHQKFTAADFKRIASEVVDDISRRGKLPIIVGGTGLYIDSVLFDYKFGKLADEVERSQLEQLELEQLQELCRVKNIDLPENYKNKRHLIRAIQLKGLIKSERRMRENTLVVGISTKKEVLAERIRMRLRQMFKDGILEETKYLGEKYGWNHESLTGNAYRAGKRAIQGEATLEEVFEDSVRSDLALAKRQMTWFKRNPHVIWGAPSELLDVVSLFVVKS